MLTFRDITAADRDIVIPMVVDFYHTDAVDHEVPAEIMERAFAACADPGLEQPENRGVFRKVRQMFADTPDIFN